MDTPDTPKLSLGQKTRIKAAAATMVVVDPVFTAVDNKLSSIGRRYRQEKRISTQSKLKKLEAKAAKAEEERKAKEREAFINDHTVPEEPKAADDPSDKEITDSILNSAQALAFEQYIKDNDPSMGLPHSGLPIT